MTKNNQRGFALAEGLLIVVMIALLAGVGYYVYKANKDSNKQQADSSIVKQDTKDVSSKLEMDESTKWLQLTSSKKAFKMRIPDGWTINNDSATDRFITEPNPAAVTYKKGAPVKVTDDKVLGDDAPHRFSVALYMESVKDPKGTASEFTLNNGQKGTKTVATGQDQLGGTGKMTIISYEFQKNDKYYDAIYLILDGDPDNTAYVEKAIKTLEF